MSTGAVVGVIVVVIVILIILWLVWWCWGCNDSRYCYKGTSCNPCDVEICSTKFFVADNTTDPVTYFFRVSGCNFNTTTVTDVQVIESGDADTPTADPVTFHIDSSNQILTGNYSPADGAGHTITSASAAYNTTTKVITITAVVANP